MERPEFDRYSGSYDELLKDPLRDRFTGGESQFFYERKCALIRSFFRRRRLDVSQLGYLDVGCGRGELLGLLHGDFARTAGCDVSEGMMSAVKDCEHRVQTDPGKIPFADAEFDFVTAVCVFHHVAPAERAGLTAEIARVLRPGGIYCLIEHNPWNPVTRTIVKRAPVDRDAILLNAGEGVALAAQAGLEPLAREYFLYFPKSIYTAIGAVEALLRSLPLGGQYAVFSRKPER